MKKILTFAILSVFLTGCAKTENGQENKENTRQEIAIVVDQELSTLDSTLATDTYGITALNNVMEGLYRLDESNTIIPAGAKELPEISEDLLTYSIKLNEEATWSNGTPVTANDYVFAWQKAVSPDTGSEYNYLFNSIENASDIIEGKADPDTLGIVAKDDYELEVSLAQPTPYFESLLAFPTFFPQNKEFVEKEKSEYAKTNTNLIYNGPFVLEEFDGPGTDTEWTYVKNDQYWDKDKVTLDRISNRVIKEPGTSVKLFEAGEVDDLALTGELAQQYQDDEAFLSLDKAGTTYISYNHTNDFFKNEKARKAILLVLDRKQIVDQILANGSVVPKGLVPSGMSFSPANQKDFADETTNFVKEDIEEAKKLWEEAKKETGTTEITLDLLAYDDDAIKKLAEAIQFSIEDNLDGAKIDVSIVPVSVAIEKGQKTEFDLFLFGWSADYADPSSFMDLFTTDSPHNYGKYSNTDYDELVKKAATTDVADENKRWDDYVQAENILLGEAAINPIFQKAEARLRNPNLKGVISHSTGAQFDYKNAYVEE
ncbi:peptide ABC transporter substrate-binding protein [Vagococcus elongatus]|uniref:Peptide ABC transporter substrate-binding protein n=1 Tax=Vagococcus elongatus TaxID=180344 RepID=A0A430B1X6_9ENTE|nr:peptide ABC transporter substrate-binding protein [Vagococcus elongatus]RSU14326.1 peptide ABC transporter substrate-binding protein [Vagococcus elongatus]